MRPIAAGRLLLEARDINDSGMVAGMGLHDGEICAFRLKLPKIDVIDSEAKPVTPAAMK